MKDYVISDIFRARLMDYLEEKPAKEVMTFLTVLSNSPTVDVYLQQKNKKPEEVKQDG